MKKQEEVFKDIPGYEGLYQISNLGRVKSLARISKRGTNFLPIKERILKPGVDGSGYYFVRLCLKGTIKTIKVHQLVAMTFLGHIPNGYKIVVDHINNNSLDNRPENLQLISQRENISKDRKNGASEYTGVCWSKQINKWASRIYINGKNIHLGVFNSEEEASKYYQNALKAIENDEEIIIKNHIFSSNYKGVCWDKKRNKWRSVTTINGKTKHLGSFNTELEAHNAYQNKLKEIQNEG